MLYVPFAIADALNVTVPLEPKHIGSATATEFVPPATFGNALITNESVIVPGVIVVVQPEADVTTLDKLIVVVPAFVNAEDGIVNVPVPEATTTPLAVCVLAFAPLNV